MKLFKVFQNYRSQQETLSLCRRSIFLLLSSFKPSFLHKHFPKFFTANAENKTKGVAILFSKNVPFTLTQEIKDPHGRYLLLKGYIGPLLYTLLSYYAPNTGQVAFFSSMFCTLSRHFEGLVVCGGDFNLALDISLDKSKPVGSKLRSSTRANLRLARLLHSKGLVDIWQEKHPSTRDYIHYFHVHHFLHQDRSCICLIPPCSLHALGLY